MSDPRSRPSRTLWIAAILVSLVCVAALAYGLIVDWDTEPASTPMRPTGGSANGGGFGFGLMIGIGAGIAIGSWLVMRKRQP